MAVKEEAKKTVKKAAPAKKAAEKKAPAKKAASVVAAAKAEVKKTVAKKAPAKAAKLEIVIESPMGGSITTEEIVAKLPKGVQSVYVKVEQNKLWWVKGEETGSVDIW